MRAGDTGVDTGCSGSGLGKRKTGGRADRGEGDGANEIVLDG